MHEFGADEGSFSSDQPHPSSQRVQSALDALKAQHAALLKSMHNLTYIDANQSGHGSPLPGTTEEDESHPQAEGSSRLSTPRRSKRASIATTVSDTLSEWFDALDVGGAEEFIMGDHTTPDGIEQASRILTNESRSSLGQTADSSVDTDIEDAEKPIPSTFSVNAAAGLPHNNIQVIRRTQLPARPVGDEGSLFAILKKNVGKVSCFVQ